MVMLASEQDLSARTAGVILGLLLVARLLLGVAYSAAIPLGEAPDEADHYAYASYIGREHRLPVGTEMTQGKHPPLYYLLAAGAAGWTGMDFAFLRSNPDVGFKPGAPPNFFVHTILEGWPWRDGALAMHLARLVSVLAGLVLTAATYALGCTIWPGWRAGALAAAAFVAFLPEGLFVGGAVSNDMLAAALATLALLAGLRGKGYFGAALAGVLVGLAVLTKASTATLGLVVVCSQLLAWRSRRRELGPALLGVLVTGSAAALVVAPWVVRNWLLYGDPLGWPVVLGTIDRRVVELGPAEIAALARGWIVSFWGKFGGAGHLVLPPAFYVVWAMLVLLAVTGWVALSVRPSRRRFGRTSNAGWVVLFGAPVMTILAILSYSEVALGTDQGRLLFPALGPIALLLVAGLAAWLPQRPKLLAGGAAVGMAAIATLALFAGIVGPYSPPLEPRQGELAAATPVNQRFGSALELVAVGWSGTPPDQVTLYWQMQQPVGDDLRAELRVTDAAGNVVWGWKRSPGAGRFSTDRWPAGRIVADSYSLPADATGQVELGVRAFPDGAWLKTTGGDFLVLRPAS